LIGVAVERRHIRRDLLVKGNSMPAQNKFGLTYSRVDNWSDLGFAGLWLAGIAALLEEARDTNGKVFALLEDYADKF
jgi:hypothetical protein